MKLSQLKSIVKEAVKEAIQEEMKDILMEAVRSPKQQVYETTAPIPQYTQPTTSTINHVSQTPLPETDKLKLRENMMSVLDGMRPGANGTLNATSADVQPLQMGAGDTTSVNGSLPGGNVSMDQIMGLMKGNA